MHAYKVFRAFALVMVFLIGMTALAQDKKKVVIGESTTTADGFTDVEKMTEYEFLSSPDTPKVFTMDKALEVSKLTGKPVLCWMGKNTFADPNMRRLSQELKDDTIQAMMDGDGTEYDQFNPRVKFDSANYVNGGKTYTVSAADFKFESPSVPKEKTTAYTLRKIIHEKYQPDGKDRLAK